MLDNVRNLFHELPNKKKYLEVITAFLSIPVLLTVIYTNVARIKDEKSANTTQAPEKTEKIVILTQTEAKNSDAEEYKSPTPEPTATTAPVAPKECRKEVGPVKISSPNEEEVVQDEMVCVKIDYTVGDYCSVAWSYRLDSNPWSDYTSSPFCFSKLDQGRHELDLRVQSTVSSDEITLERNFYYKTRDPAPTPTPAAAI